jgi:asparagine synthase (glutamine-hydrolysing)
MCGICGKLSFTGEDVERVSLERMCATIVHRGPDAQGIEVMGPAALAQRRLSIIDLSPSGTAPLSNEDGSIWATLNGEIYNFRELRTELMARGHRFRTGTDTEVLVHLYEEHGDDCVRRLDGMFAFAIWDARRQRLLAARDRLGKKPLFYTKTARSLVFASSIAALLTDDSVSREPNYRALDDYLTRQYVPSPDTAFAGIFKLGPARYLTCDRHGTLAVHRYWQPPLAQTDRLDRIDTRELESEIVERLRQAVQRRMVADVPLGAFLSGGIDSSAVVALMAGLSDRPVKTFSIGFEEAEFNELPYARELARRYGTDHHEFIVRAEAASVLPDLVRHYGEPFADASALPTYYLSKLTRQHVTVALSGDGGDENFGGYENYGIVSSWGAADAVPAVARRAVHSGVGELIDRLPRHDLARRVGRAAEMWAGDTGERFRLQTSILKPSEQRAAYTDHFRALIGPADVARRSSDVLPGNADPLAWMMWHDLQFYLPDCLMVKVDVASMASSLEVRAPMLDHHFVEFASAIPSGLKRSGSEGKVILKRALRSLVPADTLDRPKKGFGVPLRRWFTAELLDLTRGTLLDERAQRRGLFDAGFMTRLIADHVSGRRDASARIWAFLWLELWFREFID